MDNRNCIPYIILPYQQVNGSVASNVQWSALPTYQQNIFSNRIPDIYMSHPHQIYNHLYPLGLRHCEVTNQVQRGEIVNNQIIHKKREKNQKIQWVSAKKNSQSNLINHFLTFYTNLPLSERQIKRIIFAHFKTRNIQQQFLQFFCSVLKLINFQRGRRYINTKVLVDYFTQSKLIQDIPDLHEKLEMMGDVRVNDVSCLLRKCFFLFVKDDSLNSVLTSKRISVLSKTAHIEKRRKMLNCLIKNVCKN